MFTNMYANMPPPWMWPAGQQTPQQDPVTMITQWQQSLDALKKAFKEEKKEEKKKGPELSGIGLMLFMILISPVTGPGMYYFFQMSLHLLPQVK